MDGCLTTTRECATVKALIRNPSTKFMEAYCVKCKSKREMKDPKPVTLKNGKPATKGTCPVCGTSMMRIGKPV